MFAAAFALTGAMAGIPTLASADTPDPSSSCVTETPNAGAPATDQPLQVCASFDKSSYRSSDVIKLTMKITDLGTATAAHVMVSEPLSGNGFRTEAAVSGLFAQARDIPPNATVTFEQDGYAGDPDSSTVTFTAPVFQGSPIGHDYGPQVSISASLTKVVASYGGTVFDDMNRNGSRDPGEGGVGGIKIELRGPFDGLGAATSPSTFDATTDQQGDFRLDNLPGGQYSLSVSDVPNGMIVHTPPGSGQSFAVDGSPGQTSELFPATAPLSTILTATMSFDQPSYHIGQPAHLKITLSNTSGSTTISGIQTSCDHAGFPNQVLGLGKDWQVLDGPGITLGPGQTKVLDLVEVVTAGSAADGQFFAECAFGPDAFAGDFEGYPDPTAQVTALPALSKVVNPKLKLIDDDPTGGTPQTEVLLLDPPTQDPVDDGFFDGTVGPFSPGTLTFTGLPVGCYGLDVRDNWHLAPGQTNIMNTAALTNGEWDVHVLPGSAPQPSLPAAPCPTTTPPPPSTTTTTTAAGSGSGSSSGSGGNGVTATGGGHPLPFTGVNVLGYAIPALVLIVIGAGAVLFTRRRKTIR